MLDDTEVQQTVQQAESLLGKVERLEDEQARLIAVNAVRALMTLYGEALERIVAHAGEEPPLLETLAADELISHLLLLHDLHPIAAGERIRRALQELETYLHSQAAEAELMGVQEGVATVRLVSGAGGGRKLHETVQRAVLQAAPELRGVQVEDGPPANHKPQPASSSFIPLETLAPLQESESNG